MKWSVYFLFLLVPAIAGGASFTQVGVGGDFVSRQDRLYFARWDGSLTALDIESGEPVLRARGDFWGSLRDVPEGLLVLGYWRWRLLDWDTLHELQGKDRVYSSQYRNEIVVYDDGYGHFTALRLQTDEVLWTFSRPGAVSLRIDGEHVLLHCSGRYGYGTPVIVLLDLFTGEEIF